MTKKNKKVIGDFIDFCLDFYQDRPDGKAGRDHQFLFNGICDLVIPFCYSHKEGISKMEVIENFLNRNLPDPIQPSIVVPSGPYCWEQTEEGVKERVKWLNTQKQNI